jgi:predicted transposase YbfD/YdcC
MKLLMTVLSALPDPRVERTKKHALLDVLVIGVLAVMCGAEGWEDIAEFGEIRHAWLKTFLPLKNGIPSSSTFARVFRRIDPRGFTEAFSRFVEALRRRIDKEVVAIDGKAVRGALPLDEELGVLHLVHAWSADNQLLLGQQATEQKSNEITAIPALLDVLDVEGAIVTIDAMGCQTEIVAKVIKKEADYVIAVKDNQRKLHAQVRGALDEYNGEVVSADLGGNLDGPKSHGRREHRRAWAMPVPEWFEHGATWSGMKSWLCVETTRHVEDVITTERRYFISSLPAAKSEDVVCSASAVRAHWSVENHLHWSLDVLWKEDQCRIRPDRGAENLAALRRLALMLYKQDKEPKTSIRRKMKRAMWEPDYLLRMLARPIR